MYKTRNITKSQWTNLWKSLGIYVAKPKRTLKSYSISRDKSQLRSLGVTDEAIDKVLNKFNNGYQEPKLQFLRFSRFFKKDVETTVAWSKASTTSEAFLKLFNKLNNCASFENAQNKLKELYILHEYNWRGQGRYFELKYKGSGSINKLDSTYFASYLSANHKDAKYKGEKVFKIDEFTIFPILKSKNGKDLYKFIRLRRNNGNVELSVKVDSTKELNLIKNRVSTWFKSYIDIPEEENNLAQLIKFIKEGISTHFTLVGTTFFDNECLVSVYPKQGTSKNISEHAAYRTKFSRANIKSVEQLINIKLEHKDIKTRNQANIKLYTKFTDGLLGAIVISLDDKGLNGKERRIFTEDFENDFKVPLDKLIKYGDATERDYLKTFLVNTPQKQRKIKLRSDEAVRTYRELLINKVIEESFDLKADAGYCFNQDCRMRYKQFLGRKTCSSCGGPLFKSKTIVIRSINEKRIADYIELKFKEFNLNPLKLKRKLLGRDLFVIAVNKGRNTATFIPISKSLDINQLEILQYRYPDAILITSKDDATDLATMTNLKVFELHNIIEKLLDGKKSQFERIIRTNTLSKLARIANLAEQASERLADENFYKEKNLVAKNYGAELFEADCSIILENIFNNSIWLGARSRGKALPDGISAFPLHQIKLGCFILDTKFSESGRVALGTKKKNKKYILDGRKNSTIKKNGGVKGFIFISNAPAPTTFKTTFDKLTKEVKGVKISYLSAQHLLMIYEHFKEYEEQINNNSQIKGIFLEKMKLLLFVKPPKTYANIVSDTYVEKLLEEANTEYTPLITPHVDA